MLKFIGKNDFEIRGLRRFVENGGIIEQGRHPREHEPFYEYWMAEKVRRMSLKNGDELFVTAFDSTGNIYMVSGVLIDDMYLGGRN